jgi:chromosome segregation ATPase
MVGGGNQRLEGKFNSKTARRTMTKQQLTSLQNKCEEAQKEFNQVQQERRSVEVKVRELTERIQDFKRKLANFNSDLAALKAQLPLKQANFEEQKKRTEEAAISPEVLKEKEALVQKVNADYESLLKPCQEAEKAASNVAEKVNELQVNKKNKITEKLDKLTEMRKKVVEETNRKRVELKNCETNRMKTEAKLGTTRKEIEKAEKMMVKLAEKKKSLVEIGKEIRVEGQQLLAKMEEAKQAYEERKGQSNEFQQEQRMLSKDREKLENKLSDTKSEVNRLNHQRSNAVELIKNLEVKEIPDEVIVPLAKLSVEELNLLSTDELEKKIKKYSEKLKRSTPNLDILAEYNAKVRIIKIHFTPKFACLLDCQLFACF